MALFHINTLLKISNLGNKPLKWLCMTYTTLCKCTVCSGNILKVSNRGGGMFTNPDNVIILTAFLTIMCTTLRHSNRGFNTTLLYSRRGLETYYRLIQRSCFQSEIQLNNLQYMKQHLCIAKTAVATI